MKSRLLLSLIALSLLAYITGCSDKDESIETDVVKNLSPAVMPEYDLSPPPNLSAVDLGLSSLWANCNLGAKKPMDYGGYFAWGDPTGTLWSGIGIGYDENGYTWDTDLYGGNPPRRMNISGTDLDVVSRHWGNGWRIPTVQEAAELCNYCQWTLKENEGRKYYHVIGPNGNSIDMPLGGWYGDSGDWDNPYRFSTGPYAFGTVGFYWTASAIEPGTVEKSGYKVNDDIYLAWAFLINSYKGDITDKNKFQPHLRCIHMSIRPVRSKGSAPPG